MPPKRDLRRHACSRKVRFATRKDAERAAARAEARGQVDIIVYGCRFCGGLHIGHRMHAKARA